MSSNTSRILHILKYLNEHTDDEHQVSTNEIIAYLSSQNIDAHRVTIAQDIEALKSCGYDIISIKSTQNKYHMASRTFQLPELKLLIDAVLSSQLITPKKSKELIEKLLTFCSKTQGEHLKKQIKLMGRAKPVNEKIYYIIDSINTAILKEKQISFTYFEYDANKKRVLKNNKKPYILHPYGLVWNNDRYYVVGYSPKHEKISQFRVDRISKIEVLNKPNIPMPKNFNFKDYSSKVFKMFGGEATQVELLCENQHMKSIIDHFSEKVDTRIVDDEHFIATVNVCLSSLFTHGFSNFAVE